MKAGGGSAGHGRIRWKHAGGKRMRLMGKLDVGKVRWTIRQKRRGKVTAREIAATMVVPGAWVKRLCARYRHAKESGIRHPLPMGRPPGGLHGRREH